MFCCGSSDQKYCCTKADLRISDKEDRLTNTLTIVLVSVFLIILAATTISGKSTFGFHQDTFCHAPFTVPGCRGNEPDLISIRDKTIDLYKSL